MGKRRILKPRKAKTWTVAAPKTAKRKSRSTSPIAKRTRLQQQKCPSSLQLKSSGSVREVEQLGQKARIKGVMTVLSENCAAVEVKKEVVDPDYQEGQLHLLDLPPELRLIVLEYCLPYREVSRLRAVCRAFDHTCCNIIQTGFIKTQEQITHRLRELEANARSLLQYDEEPLPGVSKRSLQRNLQRQQHLRLLDFQLQLVRALTWRYVESGLFPPPYSMLVDTCQSLLHGSDRGELRPRAHIHTCRNVAMRLLKNFLKHVQDRSEWGRGGGDEPNGSLPASPVVIPRNNPSRASLGVQPPFDIALPCACLIDLLELSQMPPLRPPYGVNFRPTRSHAVHLQATYDLEGCWLGVYAGSAAHGALRRADVHILTSILCDLVCSSTETRLVGGVRDADSSQERKDVESDGGEECKSHHLSDLDIKLSTSRFRGRAPFRVYPRLHNPRQCYRGSIREATGRVFAFGHSPGSRQSLRIFLDLTASVSLVPTSLLRRLTPDAAALLQLPHPLPPQHPPSPYRPPSLSEPFIPKCSPKDVLVRNLPFEMELVMESNTDRVIYKSTA